jgi:hypothetical protein
MNLTRCGGDKTLPTELFEEAPAILFHALATVGRSKS